MMHHHKEKKKIQFLKELLKKKFYKTYIMKNQMQLRKELQQEQWPNNYLMHLKHKPWKHYKNCKMNEASIQHMMIIIIKWWNCKSLEKTTLTQSAILTLTALIALSWLPIRPLNPFFSKKQDHLLHQMDSHTELKVQLQMLLSMF